jgi:hypothetical protein
LRVIEHHNDNKDTTRTRFEHLNMVDYDYVPCMPNPIPLLLIQSSQIYVSGERIITPTRTKKKPSRKSGVSREMPMHNPHNPPSNALSCGGENAMQCRRKRKANKENHQQSS